MYTATVHRRRQVNLITTLSVWNQNGFYLEEISKRISMQAGPICESPPAAKIQIGTI